MITSVTAGFDSADSADTALGRLSRSHIPLLWARVEKSELYDPGDMRPGTHKTLFERDRKNPDPIPSRWELKLEAESENCAEIHGLLANSGAYGIRTGEPKD